MEVPGEVLGGSREGSRGLSPIGSIGSSGLSGYVLRVVTGKTRNFCSWTGRARETPIEVPVSKCPAQIAISKT